MLYGVYSTTHILFYSFSIDQHKPLKLIGLAYFYHALAMIPMNAIFYNPPILALVLIIEGALLLHPARKYSQPSHTWTHCQTRIWHKISTENLSSQYIDALMHKDISAFSYNPLNLVITHIVKILIIAWDSPNKVNCAEIICPDW